MDKSPAHTFAESCAPKILAVTSGPQGRNVISSNKRSFPHPPGALLIIRKTIELIPAEVVKKNPYCVQSPPKGISPVWYDLSTVPEVVSILKVIFGLIPIP